MGVGDRDLRAMLEIVYTAHEDGNGDEMPRPVLARLGALIGCDSVSYTRVDRESIRLLSMTVEPDDSQLDQRLRTYARFFAQHPGHAAYASGRMPMGGSVALSDLMDRPALGRLPLYTDFLLPRGTMDQLLCVIQVSKKQGTVLTFNRSRPGFADRHRDLVNLATPHLVQAVAHRERLAQTIASRQVSHGHLEHLEQAAIGFAELTSREQQVGELVAMGHTDRQVARILLISPRTVQKHVENIYQKLGPSNRATLAAAFHRPATLRSSA
jgi:DNA-binding CsgD family transcriptional regulator